VTELPWRVSDYATHLPGKLLGLHPLEQHLVVSPGRPRAHGGSDSSLCVCAAEKGEREKKGDKKKHKY